MCARCKAALERDLQITQPADLAVAQERETLDASPEISTENSVPAEAAQGTNGATAGPEGTRGTNGESTDLEPAGAPELPRRRVLAERTVTRLGTRGSLTRLADHVESVIGASAGMGG